VQQITLDSLVGREREVEALRSFLLSDGVGAEALALEGPAGIGKTAVWRAGAELARDAGLQVLVSRPSTLDSMLGFVGIADLLDGVDLRQLEGVPEAQLRALESAVVVREGHVADGQVVYAAFLSALRALAARTRLLVAIDDLQWLDQASSAAISFAARRLEHDDVRFLLTLRTPADAEVVSHLHAALAVETIAAEPLSLGAVSHLVHSRLGLSLSRIATRRIHEISDGNPLFALELARALRDRKTGAMDDREIPLPDRLENVLADRVQGLAPGARRALLAVSLSRNARIEEITSAVGEKAVDDAEYAGVIVEDRTRVRASHPLLAEVVKSRAAAAERRALHRRLAEIASDSERRALHLSHATRTADATVAAIVAAAAAKAYARGAAASAAELGERALELTPPDDPAQLERRLDAAEYRYMTGALHRTVELLPDIDSLPPGPDRGRAALLKGGASLVSADASGENLLLAVADTDPRSRLGAMARSRLAFNDAIGLFQNIERGRALAEEGLIAARALGERAIENEARAAMMWCQALLGESLDEQLAHVADTDEWRLYHGTSRIKAVDLIWRGRLTDARALLDSLLTLADERGEGESYYALRVQLCEVEMRAGRWSRLAELVEEWEREPREAAGHGSALRRFQTFLALGGGDFRTAIELGNDAVAASEEVGIPWHGLESRRALGVALMMTGDAGAACRAFLSLQERIRTAGARNPGAFPVAPDLIQALTLTGSTDQAQDELATLRDQAVRQDNAWAHAAALRADGYVQFARGEDSSAAEAFDRAARAFASLAMPFDQARSLTALGQAQRRLRRKREARETLEAAAALFEELGSPGWAELARQELARIGGRRAAGETLTPTEQRVAELVASGLANKQVAATLVVSVGTVEAHLTRIYAKVGVRSRTELVRAMTGS
jgi:DNA-binding NarL/FixJ family response regulator